MFTIELIKTDDRELVILGIKDGKKFYSNIHTNLTSAQNDNYHNTGKNDYIFRETIVLDHCGFGRVFLEINFLDDEDYEVFRYLDNMISENINSDMFLPTDYNITSTIWTFFVTRLYSFYNLLYQNDGESKVEN